MPSIALKDMEKYCFADLAAGKDARNRRRSARQCIVLGARDWLDRWFFPFIWAGRLTTSQFKEKILSVQEKYEPRRFGLEANGMQVLFGNLIRDEAIIRFGSGTVKMLPIYQPTKVEKTYRIRTGFEPPLNQGRIFILESSIDARAEIQGFPTAQTKDIIDAMETVINRVAPKRPINTQKTSEETEYAKYLRNTGMPAHLIKIEMEKFHTKRMDVIN